MNNVIITAKDLHRGYKVAKKSVDVLKGIDLEIEQGEKVFLCGPSGAGKTTLMYTLAGLEAPDRGSVHIGESDLYALSKKKQSKLRNAKMSYIFQNYYLLPELTALENVLIPALIGGNDRTDQAISILRRVGLGHRLDHLPTELSGGEQQRVAIARALVNQPQIIFADEPTGNLDTKNGSEVMEILLELSNEYNATLVVVTHDPELAKLGDRILTITDGKIASKAD